MTNDNVLHIAVDEFFITLQKSHVRLKHDKMRKNGSPRLHHQLDILHLTVKYIPQQLHALPVPHLIDPSLIDPAEKKRFLVFNLYFTPIIKADMSPYLPTHQKKITLSHAIKHVLFNVLTFGALASTSPCVSVVNSPPEEHRLHPVIKNKTLPSSNAFTIGSTCGQTTLLLGSLM